jgi:SAM-dependent methyltransferase
VGERPGNSAIRAQEAEACPVCSAALPARAAIVGTDRLLGLPGEFEVHICAVCGAGCTTPRLAAEALARFYPPGYGSHEEANGGLYAAVIARLKRLQVAAILRRAPFSEALGEEPGRALDVGCGRGDLARGLIVRGWRVDGIEPSRRAASLARERNVEVIGSTLSTATLAERGYDLVVLRHSLEHLPEPVGDLRRVREALRPGGRVAISLPNFACWQRLRFGARWFHLDVPRHRVHFSGSSLAHALSSAGLAVRSQSTSTSVLGLPATLQYVVAGRCLAPGGVWLRIGAAACCAAFPLTWLIDRLGGELDTLHVVAERA